MDTLLGLMIAFAFIKTVEPPDSTSLIFIKNKEKMLHVTFSALHEKMDKTVFTWLIKICLDNVKFYCKVKNFKNLRKWEKLQFDCLCLFLERMPMDSKQKYLLYDMHVWPTKSNFMCTLTYNSMIPMRFIMSSNTIVCNLGSKICH